MDFFTRLKHRLSMSRVTAKPTQSAQLEKFHACWTYCHSTYFMRDQKDNRKVHVQLTSIPGHLKTMVDILVQEEIKQEDEQTGVCMEYLLKHGVLGVLVNISEGDFPLGIRGETIRTIATLVNLLDVKFLIHAAVHIPTLKLLKLCIPEDHTGGDKFNNFYVDDLIDLLYTLCSKIHASPQLLNIFFYDKRWLTTPLRSPADPNLSSINSPTSLSITSRHDLQINNRLFSPTSPSSRVDESHGAPNELTPTICLSPDSQLLAPRIQVMLEKPEYECLLFSYLLKFIHREGKSGDYARTGLLFLLEISSGNFRDYVLHHSNLCDILGACLGALYSQLPRKLRIKGGDSDGAGGRYISLGTAHLLVTRSPSLGSQEDLMLDECELASSPTFRSHLDAFLKILEFYQDVLQRCPSRAICMALLRDIRTIFLENILYPSMLESSDQDGSAVAVMSYIDMTLHTLKDGELLDLFVRYLVSCDDDELLPIGEADDDQSSVHSGTSSQLESLSSKQSNQQPANNNVGQSNSNNNATTMVGGCLAFNLKDLLLNNLRSDGNPAIVSALKLLTTLVSRHPQYCLPLLSSNKSNNSNDQQHPGWVTIESHHMELKAYFLLITNLDPRFNDKKFISGYEPYLKSAEEAYQIYSSEAYLRREQAKSKSHARKHTLMSKLTAAPVDEAAAPTTLVKDTGMLKKFPQPNELHSISHQDPILLSLVDILTRFFTNSCELNLCLTETLAAICRCPFLSLENWLGFRTELLIEDISLDRVSNERLACDTELPRSPGLSPSCSNASFDDDASDDDMDLLIAATLPYSSRLPQLDVQLRRNLLVTPRLQLDPPKLFQLFNQLAKEVNLRRQTLPELEAWLDERRSQLLLNSCDIQFSAPIGSQVASPNLLPKSKSPSSSSSPTASHNNNTLLSPPLLPTNSMLPANQAFADNILILEESIKELVAIQQVRRGLGLNEVLFT